MRRATAVGLGALLTLSMAACGPEATREVEDSARWRTSQAPVDTTGLIWSTGTTVNFPDGTVIDMGTEVHGYLVAGDGVFFFPLHGEDGVANIHDRELWFAAPGEEPEATGLVVNGDAVVASPDGQHLAAILLDDDEGMGDATVVGYDLTTGDEWRSEDGMDGPVDEIDEFEVRATGVDNDLLYGQSLDGTFAWDLDTGEGHEVDVDDVPVARQNTSPDGTYEVTDGERGGGAIKTSAGEVIPLSINDGSTTFGFWLDDDTAVGVYESTTEFREIVTCDVPSGQCDIQSQIQGDRVVFPMIGDDGAVAGLYQISGIPES